MDDLNKAIDDFIAEQDEASARNDYEYAEMIRVLRPMKATRFLLGLLAERRRAGKLVGHGEKEELLQAEIERLRGLLSPDFTGRVDDKERALEDTLGRAHAERLATEPESVPHLLIAPSFVNPEPSEKGAENKKPVVTVRRNDPRWFELYKATIGGLCADLNVTNDVAFLASRIADKAYEWMLDDEPKESER